MTHDVVDLRQHRIRYAREAVRRAGYRAIPPPDAEADLWTLVFEVGETEDGHSCHRPLWFPRKQSEDWQRARFGPCEPPHAGSRDAGKHSGQEEKKAVRLSGSADMSDTLDRMRRNPAADWTISDVQAVCAQHGVRCVPPSGGGSHYKVSHPSQQAILTVPRARPVKAVYIRKLVKFIEAVIGDAGAAS